MKINAIRRFFTEDYKDVPPGNWFNSLLGSLNQFTDPIITALRNQITFQDNFRCQVKTLTFSSMQELQISTGFASPPLGAIVLTVDGAMSLGVQVRPIKSGIAGITLKLSDDQPHQATVVIFQ